MVILAVGDALERADGVGDRHEQAGRTGEHFGHVERLGQEALDLAGAGHDQLVFLRQLVHSQDGDDVLQRLVCLQDALHLASSLVMLVADDAGVQRAGRGVQRIDRRVDAQLGDGAG